MFFDHLQDLVPDIQFPVSVSFPIDGPVLGFGILAAALAAGFCGLWSGLEARWQTTAAMLRAEEQRRASIRTIGRVLLIGGCAGLLLLGLMVLFRLPSKLRVILPALAVAVASLLIGITWIGWMPAALAFSSRASSSASVCGGSVMPICAASVLL